MVRFSARVSVGSSNVTPTANANDAARRVESKVAVTQPESNGGTKKAGSAVLVNIDKANQKMTVFVDGVKKIRLASLNR